MKNHQNAPKKNHHEKTCCAHSSVADNVTSASQETTSGIQTKNKNAKKH